MKNVVLGVLAHVDSGKTTLSEALLYQSGRIRKLGRVDHKDAYLDTDRLEKERGITIFSKQAVFDAGDLRIYLQDTPGHADFSSEMERTLSALDYALLIVSGPDGLQAHSETLIELLRRHRIPFLIWVNKMDICEKSRAQIMDELRARLGDGAVDMTETGGKLPPETLESVAVCGEETLEKYLSTGALDDADIASLLKSRRLIPCFFGSALKLDGTDRLLSALERYIIPPEYPEVFAARVIKISRDERGDRLTWIKVTGGSLSVRESLRYLPADASGSGTSGEPAAAEITAADLSGRTGQAELPAIEEKVSQIRIYSGNRFEAVQSAEAGAVAAVLGLSATYAGQGFGAEPDSLAPLLVPALSYSIFPPAGTDPAEAYRKLRVLSEEDPELRIVWDPHLREIQAQLMGEVQIEVLKSVIAERFGMDVEIGSGRIMYRETIASPVEGAGHFEPLRHYAEVHLLMEPLPAGTGIIYDTAVSTDELDLNWQRLIIGNLMEKRHLGVLTGSPLTDVKITLIAGRTHLKHTEGGDIRQASLRAVRQGLMKAQNVLLEPYFDFVLEVPPEHIGRAIYDVKAMHAGFEGPEELAGNMVIRGRAPVASMQDYQKTLLSYTRGRGKLSCRACGYFPCHNTAEVVESIAYEPERDVENTPDSVFCSHGSGVIVKWDKSDGFMHLDSGLKISGGEVSQESQPKLRGGSLDLDERELEAIMLREFGPAKRPVFTPVVYEYGKARERRSEASRREYLIVDGYNVIFAWEELKKAAAADIGAAREALWDLLANYRAYRGCETVLIFDGYRRPGPQAADERGGVRIMYTKQGESADLYIERLVREMRKDYAVSVVSSDAMIQLAALRNGVRRMSSRELQDEIGRAGTEISEIISRHAPQRIKLGDAVRITKKDK